MHKLLVLNLFLILLIIMPMGIFSMHEQKKQFGIGPVSYVSWSKTYTCSAIFGTVITTVSNKGDDVFESTAIEERNYETGRFEFIHEIIVDPVVIKKLERKIKSAIDNGSFEVQV